jgi:guanyl-specific ribonuclease Sa
MVNGGQVGKIFPSFPNKSTFFLYTTKNMLPLPHASIPFVASLALFFLFATACRFDSKPPSTEETGSTGSGSTQTGIPRYVLDVLAYVRTHNEAPNGYVGGRTFENRERRLLQKSPDGKNIRYREWDVLPKIPGQNRGAERLITGSDKSAYYTKDHYRTFIKIKQ